MPCEIGVQWISGCRVGRGKEGEGGGAIVWVGPRFLYCCGWTWVTTSLEAKRGCGAAQAVPSLGAQAVTLAAWCGSRAILYSSYYAIVAALVGFRWSSFPRLLLPGPAMHKSVGLREGRSRGQEIV